MNSKKIYKEEIKKILSHFITLFSTNLVLFISISFCAIFFNLLSGAYLLSIINFVCVIPALVYYIICKIKNQNFLNIVSIYGLIFTAFIDFFISGVIYDRNYPYLALWFFTLFYLINTVSSGVYAVFIHIIIIFAIYGIFYWDFLDYSRYAEENINNNILMFSHIAAFIIAIIVIEWTNAKLFYQMLREIISKNMKLQEFQKNQENIQALKDNFFVNISHEMRTPLNAIKGISDLINTDSKASSEIDEFKKILIYSSNHLLNLVNDVLDFTKINLGEFILIDKIFNLEENIKLCFEINSKSTTKKDIILSIEKVSAIPKYVLSDGQRFSQLTMNLISNAIKYTNNGYVKLVYGGTICKDNPTIFNLLISIEDTGIGIDDDELNKIFEKYYQSKNHNLQTGVGLGLFISKNIIDMMNGTIDVKSKPNFGTTFTITIPMKIAEVESDNTPSTATFNEHKLSNINLLVVEDNQINQVILVKLLNKNIKHCRIEIANNGKEALEIIKKIPFDVILMDLSMPVMDGYEATKWIRKSTDERIKNIPIIALTANVWENDINMCYQIGINAIITKPFEINDLISKVSNYVNNSKIENYFV